MTMLSFKRQESYTVLFPSFIVSVPCKINRVQLVSTSRVSKTFPCFHALRRDPHSKSPFLIALKYIRVTVSLFQLYEPLQHFVPLVLVR
jgi:hypothetical protein